MMHDHDTQLSQDYSYQYEYHLIGKKVLILDATSSVFSPYIQLLPLLMDAPFTLFRVVIPTDFHPRQKKSKAVATMAPRLLGLRRASPMSI